MLPDLSSPCLEHAPLPVATLEGTTHLVRYVNPAFCRLIDKSQERAHEKAVLRNLAGKERMPDAPRPHLSDGMIRKLHGAGTLQPSTRVLVLHDVAGDGGRAHDGRRDSGDRDHAALRKSARDERGVAAQFAVAAAEVTSSRQSSNTWILLWSRRRRFTITAYRWPSRAAICDRKRPNMAVIHSLSCKDGRARSTTKWSAALFCKQSLRYTRFEVWDRTRFVHRHKGIIVSVASAAK
jgi:hypothetical protein